MQDYFKGLAPVTLSVLAFIAASEVTSLMFQAAKFVTATEF